MPDLSAPQHSDALNAMLGLPPVRPQQSKPLGLDAVPRLEADQHRHVLRRRAAARARARREAA